MKAQIAPEAKLPPMTVQAAAINLGVSDDTARRVFAAEPGVLRIGQATRLVGRKYKRRYFTIRIPLAVFERVRDRIQQK
jgi:hypothetical protein